MRRWGCCGVDEARITADDFFKASKALKKAGEKELRKELNKSLRTAVKPLIPRTRVAALRTLPSRGGLAKAVSRAPQRVQVRTGQETAGVRVVVGKRRGSAARDANDGTIRHPVFGNTEVYVEQQVTPGWFDDTMKREAPSVKPAVEDAVLAMIDRIVREVR